MTKLIRTASAAFVAAALALALPNALAMGPDPALTPAEVVGQQLEALRNNDQPHGDAGIERTWAFAHPASREVTGPLERFTEMMYGPNYSALINHASHSVVEAGRGDNVVVFDVTVLSASGTATRYGWQVEKVDDGSFAGCWMTTGVSPATPAGAAI